MTDDPVQTIKKTNREFAAILKQELKDEILFPRQYDFHELRQLFNSDNGIMIPTQFGFVNEKQYKVLMIVETLDAFWKENTHIYAEAISKLPNLSVIHETYNAALTTYFDTTIIPLDIFPFERLFIQQTVPIFHQQINIKLNFMMASTLLVRIKKLIPLLEADTDNPIIALAFPFLDTTSLARTLEPQVGMYKLSGEYFSIIVSGMLKTRTLPTKHKEWMSLDFKGTMDLEKVLDLDSLRNTLEGVAGSLLIDEEDVSNISAPNDLFKNVLEGKDTIVDLKTFRMIGTLLHKSINTTLRMLEYCGLYHGDLSLKWPGIFKEKLEIDADQFKGISGITDEFAAAQVLKFPEFKWFEEMSIQDVIRLRDEKGMEIVRTAFREERKRIKHAELGDFNGIALSVRDNLLKMVNEHEDQILMSKDYYAKKLERDFLGLTGSMSLGFISIALPLLSVPSAVFSLILGTQSIKHTLKDAKTGREEIERLKGRPIGIIAKYFPRSSY